jgi:hypothetical protein
MTVGREVCGCNDAGDGEGCDGCMGVLGGLRM